MGLLDQLNPQQREAVETTDGPLLILAGAGSGKTRVITYRIAYLINYRGVPPGNLLAVTFTNKAADEMRSRVDALLHESGGMGAGRGNWGRLERRPWISTFHSFCVRLLREDGRRIGLPRDFSIYDQDDQLRVVKSCLRRLGLSERELQSRTVLARISHAKNHGLSPELFYQRAADPLAAKMANVFQMYNDSMKTANAVDFDDLLLKAVCLLSEDAETALKYNERFHYILVDEYQDTNRPQYELVRLLTQRHQNLCVVGDEDQSIYSWRGADIRNIVEFEKDFPQARIIRLEENYRSTQAILDAASALVSHNVYRKGKKLWTTRQGSNKVYCYVAPDGENESLFTADWIAKRRQSHPDERIAILYRTNAQSRLYEEALRRYGLKYNLVGGFSFYERVEVKDLLAYLKAAANTHDSISLLRIINSPPRGIGDATINKLEEYALANNLSVWDALERILDEKSEARGKQKLLTPRAASALASFRDLMKELQQMIPESNVPKLLSTILERTAYRAPLEEEGSPESISRLENIDELLNAANDSMERGEGLAEFLDHAALVSEVDSYDEGALTILMTLHSAKGLEFPVVFLGGLEEGLLPHSRSLLIEDALEEERRLCYVGMTRARDILILTRARARRRYGERMPDSSTRSRFWDEVPNDLLEDLSKRTLPRAPYPAKFSPGERVYDYESSESEEIVVREDSFRNINQYFHRTGGAPHAIPADRALGAPGVPTRRAKPASQGRGPRSGLEPGCRVRHPKYGYGTVLHREGNGEEAKLTVSFPGLGLKKLVEKYADLERV